MRKTVKVNYPKKKPRLKLEDLGDVSEPERYTMYEVLLNNLKIANRATFLHRIIYVGEHFFLEYEDATTYFEKIIRRANETYCLEKLSGFFLYYPQFFVHMVEGDEDNLNKHLGYLFEKKPSDICRIGSTKLLIHVSHINQRFFENWVHFTGVPPKLLEKLDVSLEWQQSGRYIYNCIKKIYSLMGNYADELATMVDVNPPRKSYDVGTIASLESYLPANRMYPSYSYVSQAASMDPSDQATAKDYKLFLPEYELLDFIIHCSYTMKLEEYYGLYGVVPMRDVYKDRVWPVPHDFIPYDIFEKPYDCITELPKESRKPRITGDITPSVSKSTFGEPVKEPESDAVEEVKEDRENSVL